jgi:hypothetical protein
LGGAGFADLGAFLTIPEGIGQLFSLKMHRVRVHLAAIIVKIRFSGIDVAAFVPRRALSFDFGIASEGRGHELFHFH